MKLTRYKAKGVPKSHDSNCMTRKPESERTHPFCDCTCRPCKRFQRVATRQRIR